MNNFEMVIGGSPDKLYLYDRQPKPPRMYPKYIVRRTSGKYAAQVRGHYVGTSENLEELKEKLRKYLESEN